MFLMTPLPPPLMIIPFRSSEQSWAFIHLIFVCIATDLVSVWQKKNFADFVRFAIDFDPEKPIKKSNFEKGMTTEAMFKIFKIVDLTDVIGHAIALHIDDE